MNDYTGMTRLEAMAVRCDAHSMDAVCGCCGKSWGAHTGAACNRGGGVFRLSGNPIAEAPEAKPAEPTHDNCFRGYNYVLGRPCYCGAPVAATERQHPPLPYFTEQQERAKFDPFKGYEVTRYDAADLMPAAPGHTHHLQRLADGHSPVFGSAALLR